MARIVGVHGAFHELWGPNEVAGRGCIAPRYVLVDQTVDNGHRAHDPEPYLNATATGLAVAGGLARAAR